jgi:ABC-2 type transport system ATP-binding protein
MIDVSNLQVRIDGREILRGIRMHLEPGDIYGLLGPNGAGKSTTIFALLGLRRRSGGQVRVQGSDPEDKGVEIRRTIGVMPESAGFYEWMTSGDYLHWVATLYGQTTNDKELTGLLRTVGLATVRHRPIGSYSRGMKQRLAVARALVHHPTLLILDEPTNGLDPKGRREIHDLLRNFAQTRGASILLCTHLLDDVDRLCNRIGILDWGRTLLEGSLSKLLAGQGTGLRYRLRLERSPGGSGLPEGLTLLAREGEWWHIQLQGGANSDPPALWKDLLRRGWRILEIESEGGGLEELYLGITSPGAPGLREGEI